MILSVSFLGTLGWPQAGLAGHHAEPLMPQQHPRVLGNSVSFPLTEEAGCESCLESVLGMPETRTQK